jgi:hypothetical protein
MSTELARTQRHAAVREEARQSIDSWVLGGQYTVPSPNTYFQYSRYPQVPKRSAHEYPWWTHQPQQCARACEFRCAALRHTRRCAARRR